MYRSSDLVILKHTGQGMLMRLPATTILAHVAHFGKWPGRMACESACATEWIPRGRFRAWGLTPEGP
jgi:hypothetical protein